MRRHQIAANALALLATAGLLVSTPLSPALAQDPLSPIPASQHFADSDSFTPANVDRLGLAFEFRDFVVRGRTHRGVEASPILHDGVLYFSGPWGVAYAVDARSGKSLWTYDPGPEGRAARNTCCDAVNRGVALGEDRLFTLATDGKLAAVDLRSGKPLWQVETITDKGWNTSSTGAPLVAGRLVIVGSSGADMGSRGVVSAYDAASGALVWRFWVVPGDPAAGPDESPDVTRTRATWPKDTLWQLGMGGNVWDGLAYDPETDSVFVGTGNGGPHPVWLRSKSGGITDQLYLSSIVALDGQSGRVKWYYQTTPGDSWDYNACSPFVLADVMVAGRLRKVVMQAPKNGFFYMLDRTSGELLQAQPYTAVNWASHVDLITGRPVLTGKADYRAAPRVVWPSMAGGHSWTPMGFSPRTGLVYLPVSEGAASFAADSQGRFIKGGLSQSTHNAFPPFTDPALRQQFLSGPSQSIGGRLKAIDPVTGATRWTSDALPFVTGGVLVAGDLVFQGASDGYLSAYDAATGQRRLHLFVGTGIMGAPITYTLDGVPYLALLAGFGGPQGAAFPPDAPGQRYENFERLIVLKLDGGQMPLPPPRKALPLPPVPKPIPATPAMLAKGQRLFQEHCHRCHWTGGATGNYPDLWRMDAATLSAFEAIVGGGAYEYAGMGNFSDALSKADRAAIKAFLVHDTIAKRKGGGTAGAQFREASH